MTNFLQNFNIKERSYAFICLISTPIIGFVTLLIPILIPLGVICILIYNIMHAFFPSFFIMFDYIVKELRRKAIFVTSWQDEPKEHREEKVWIRTFYGNKKSPALVKGQAPKLSYEMKRFASVISWLCSTESLKPYYMEFLRRVERLIALNGSTYTFKYLKESLRLVVRALAGSPENVPELRMRIDKTGLPKILPLPLRSEIRLFMENYEDSLRSFKMSGPAFDPNFSPHGPGPKWSQKRIVSILSLIAVFRVMKTNVDVSLKTIISPFTGEVRTFNKDILKFAINTLTSPVLVRSIYDPFTGTSQNTFKDGPKIDLSIGKFIPHMSPKSGPNGRLSTWSSGMDALAFIHEPKKALILLGWMHDQKAFGWILWFLILIIVFGFPYILIYFGNLLYDMTIDRAIARFPSIYYSRFFTLIRDFLQYWRISVGKGRGERYKLYLGKLGVVYDQAGKARVVAATNWWIQSALKGLHKSIFNSLKQIPTDGTFDQQLAFRKFLAKLDPKSKMSGFDLSAATDRLPIDLQEDILNILGIDGTSWRELLSFDWAAPFANIEELSTVRYEVGQPMGAYSSWAMLALTHHIIINVAASNKGILIKDVNYAVLGDDVVINNDIVAEEYVNVMKRLGLSISLGKSVISNRFTEFAKRLEGPNDLDLSPIGAGAILSACRSGYMFPALFRSAWHNVILSLQDVLDLSSKIPSGFVAKRDLAMFSNLIIWQFAGKGVPVQVSPSQFGAFAHEWVSGLPAASSMLVTHLFDSIGNVNMRLARANMSRAHLAVSDLLKGCFTVNMMTSPFLRVLETLMTFFNPGFWLYLVKGLTFPITAWEDIEKYYASLPTSEFGSGYFEDIARLRYALENWPDLSVTALPLSKKAAKEGNTYLRAVLKDARTRWEISEQYPLHRNWYELYGSGA